MKAIRGKRISYDLKAAVELSINPTGARRGPYIVLKEWAWTTCLTPGEAVALADWLTRAVAGIRDDGGGA